jgi:hypothetical protein
MNEVSVYGFWVDELAKSITNKGRFINDAGILPIVTSLEELMKWLIDPRSYSSRHKDAWTSVIDDLEHSINNFGVLSAKYSSRRGLNLIRLLRTLPLSNQTLMRQPNTLLLRRKAFKRANSLLKHLGDTRALIDAWDDLVATTRNTASPPDRLLVLRDIFIDLAHHQGKDMGAFGTRRKVSEMLRLPVEQLNRIEVDSTDLSISEKIKANEEISIDERLLLCRDVIVQVPESHNRVLWLEISRASLHRSILSCGDILLFDGEWLMGQTAESGNLESLPSEVRNNIGRFGKYIFSGAKHTILARITLSAGIVSNAYDDAFQLLQGFIELANANKGDWLIGKGHLVYDGDLEVLYAGDNSREIEDMYNFHTDSTAEHIENDAMTATTVDAQNADKRLPQLMDLVRDLDSSRDKNSETKLLAATRLLEHVTGWTDDTVRWYEFAECNIKRSWARNTIINKLDRQVYPILFTGLRIEGVEHEALQKVREKIIPEMHHTYYSYRRDREITNLATLSKINDLYKTSRSFDWLVRAFADGRSLHSTLLNNEAQFEREMGRLIRYRNALEHGGPRHPLIADSTADFAVGTAAIAVSLTIDAFLEGKDLKAMFTRRNAIIDRKYRQLSNGGRVVGLLGNR